MIAPRQFLSALLPASSWDSHMHIIDPISFPLHPSACYTPSQNLLSDALALENSLGLRKMVLVQPSIYANDNSCLLSALRKLGPHRARGVVTFDPTTFSQSTLNEWHALGVRGVRLNLSSTKTHMPIEQLDKLLHLYADRIRPFNWILQLYIPLYLLEDLEQIIPSLNVRICLDHFGQPDFSAATLSPSSPALSRRTSSSSTHSTCSSDSDSNSDTSITTPVHLDTSSVPGLPSLLRLLTLSGRQKIYIKISAAYRLFPGYAFDEAILDAYAKMILAQAPRNVLFATDWPHTRFEGLDVRPFVEACVRWCAEVDEGDCVWDQVMQGIGADVKGLGLVHKLFRANPEEAWGGN